VHDFNGAEQDGVRGHSLNVVDGIRQNAAMVYLTAGVRRRPNLTIRDDVTIDRVLFDGTTAAAVAAADGTAYRAGEVILSGGSYGSVAILCRPYRLASGRPAGTAWLPAAARPAHRPLTSAIRPPR
jgi:choline dehydrogenase